MKTSLSFVLTSIEVRVVTDLFSLPAVWRRHHRTEVHLPDHWLSGALLEKSLSRSHTHTRTLTHSHTLALSHTHTCTHSHLPHLRHHRHRHLRFSSLLETGVFLSSNTHTHQTHNKHTHLHPHLPLRVVTRRPPHPPVKGTLLFVFYCFSSGNSNVITEWKGSFCSPRLTKGDQSLFYFY